MAPHIRKVTLKASAGTGGNALREQLYAVPEEVRSLAISGGRHGVLASRHSHGTYAVAASPEVPCGMARERTGPRTRYGIPAPPYPPIPLRPGGARNGAAGDGCRRTKSYSHTGGGSDRAAPPWGIGFRDRFFPGQSPVRLPSSAKGDPESPPSKVEMAVMRTICSEGRAA